VDKAKREAVSDLGRPHNRQCREGEKGEGDDWAVATSWREGAVASVSEEMQEEIGSGEGGRPTAQASSGERGGRGKRGWK
jgi:hypothetical protein